MSERVVEKELDGSKGRFVLREAGLEAELTFSVLSPARVIADHTGVPESLRNTGAGRALVEALVADARAQDYKVIPLCPFVNAERRKHPDWADVFDL